MTTFDPDEAADPFFDDRPMQPFANDGKVTCPECDEQIPVPILARMNGGSHMQVEPDLSEVWAHAWTHTTTEGDPNAAPQL